MTEPSPNWSAWRAEVDLESYDRRWQALAASGENPHGEADLVESFRPRRVLDAGCGTGRVAVELTRRGIEVVGVDADAEMVDRARSKAPELHWDVVDLAELDRPERFDVVVLAGNVVPFVAADSRPAAVAACARHLATDGVMIAGFSLRAGWPSLDDYDKWCIDAGLILRARFATWDRRPFTGGDYAVSVHESAS